MRKIISPSTPYDVFKAMSKQEGERVAGGRGIKTKSKDYIFCPIRSLCGPPKVILGG